MPGGRSSRHRQTFNRCWAEILLRFVSGFVTSHSAMYFLKPRLLDDVTHVHVSPPAVRQVRYSPVAVMIPAAAVFAAQG